MPSISRLAMVPCGFFLIVLGLMNNDGTLALLPAATDSSHRSATTSSAILGATNARKLTTTPSKILTQLHLVTEDDVLEAVEKAESLWAQALEARKTANALSDRAEEEAEAAASTARDAENMLKDTQSPISLEKIAQADLATKSNIDANGMVNKALEAEEEANRLESLAEEALRISEEQLSQHLVDVPDSPLAEA